MEARIRRLEAEEAHPGKGLTYNFKLHVDDPIFNNDRKDIIESKRRDND